jgi:hypothetical protein
VLTQLNPPLPLETPKGAGWAHFVIDYGPESALLWVVFMDADGACWTVPNAEVRMTYNWTLGRRQPEQRSRPPMRFPRPQSDTRPDGPSTLEEVARSKSCRPRRPLPQQGRSSSFAFMRSGDFRAWLSRRSRSIAR